MTSPAFQFYAAEFLADENVALMSNREIGCYIKLICYCWREGSIPDNLEKLSKLCGEDSSAMAQLWLSISPAFDVAIQQPSRLTHPRLEKERIKQAEHSKERAASGTRGANVRWHKGLAKNGSAIAKPMAEPMANDGSSSSSSSSSSNNKKHMSDKSDAIALLEFLNSKTGRHYRPTITTLKPVLARLRDGFTVDECRAVIARKCRDWKGDDKMEPYLRPATLFGDQKFSQYVGEVPPETADAMP